MTYEQYWYNDVWMVEAYREADKLRQQRSNNEAWVQGMYVYDAVARLSPILHAFAKKGTKPQPYTPKPYEFGREEKTDAEEERTKENERLKSILFFKNWARSARKRFEN